MKLQQLLLPPLFFALWIFGVYVVMTQASRYHLGEAERQGITEQPTDEIPIAQDDLDRLVLLFAELSVERETLGRMLSRYLHSFPTDEIVLREAVSLVLERNTQRLHILNDFRERVKGIEGKASQTQLEQRTQEARQICQNEMRAQELASTLLLRSACETSPRFKRELMDIIASLKGPLTRIRQFEMRRWERMPPTYLQ